MELIFEKSREGRGLSLLPECDVPKYEFTPAVKRNQQINLPEIAEIDLSRHYTALMKRVHGVNDGFYPLGSCTMKYNPKINDEVSAMPGFSQIHPLQPENTVQGALETICLADKLFSEITGMDAMTFQPAAGAQGEFAGLLLIKKYHTLRGDTKRDKIIVPDAAHGTNPATATMAGYKVINIDSTPEGTIDLGKLRSVVGDDTAGLMLTNPNTIGIFDKNILEITKIIHDAGGLNYYDGANLNAIVGVVRPGDMGFDVIHLNLHKTFSTPHGGGGPGSGAVGCKKILADYLPNPIVKNADGEYSFDCLPDSIGKMVSFYGNYGVYLKALTYVITLGAEGLQEAGQNAVLNANYLKSKLEPFYDIPFKGICMHEFVLSLEKFKKECGITALDVAKALLDYGMHPPTMYFPLIVKEALMIEPTETESKETLDAAAKAFIDIYQMALKDPESIHNAPKTTPVGRLDEVNAARHPKVRYIFR